MSQVREPEFDRAVGVRPGPPVAVGVAAVLQKHAGSAFMERLQFDAVGAVEHESGSGGVGEPGLDGHRMVAEQQRRTVRVGAHWARRSGGAAPFCAIRRRMSAATAACSAPAGVAAAPAGTVRGA